MASSPTDQGGRPPLALVPPDGFFDGFDGQATEHASGMRIRVLDGPALAAPLPELEYIVPEIGLVAGGGAPHMVAGYGFAGKTLAIQSLLLSLAAGTTVWGAYKLARTFRVRHVDKEQGDALTRRRYQRLARDMGVNLNELGDRIGAAIMPPLTMSLGCRADWQALMEGVDLMLVDSMRAASPGQDENSSEFREGLDMLGELSECTKCRALVIHHARKPNDDAPSGRFNIRGSSAIFDALDCAYVFAANKGEPIRVMHEKARSNGETVEDFALVVSDVPQPNEPRWGLRVELRGAELLEERKQLAEADKAKRQASVDALRVRKALQSGRQETVQLRTLTGLSGSRFAAAIAELGDEVASDSIQDGRTWKRLLSLKAKTT